MAEFENESNEHEDQDRCIMGGTIEMMRDQALMLFAKAVARMNNMPETASLPIDDAQRNFLSVAETEAIIKEHSISSGHEGMYAIGGETREEFETQMRKMFQALMVRIEANVAQYGVKQGYLDCAFDNDANNFVFSVSEKGKAVVNERFKNRNVEPSNN
jgi:hypothetical protein